MSEHESTQERIDEQAAQDVTDLHAEESEVVHEHADNWRNTPPAEQVPEWMRRRNQDEDTDPQAGDSADS